ncbi:esterase/lipase family protein [Streptomyces sp. NPDC054871]
MLLGLASPAAAAAPPRDDSVDEPVIMIHGYYEQPLLGGPMPNGYDCSDWWQSAETAMENWGWKGDLLTYGYYKSDRGCDWSFNQDRAGDPPVWPPNPPKPRYGDRDTHLGTIAQDLAWKIYSKYSSKGESVDVMAHSMGGLIIRAALSGVSNGDPDYPPYLYVEDVATLGTPHAGSRLATLCGGVFTEYIQCALMRSSSPWLKSLNGNPQGTHGTDWTLFGAESDRVVSDESATGMPAAHKVIYTRPSIIPHQYLHRVTDGYYNMKYNNTPSTEWTEDATGAAPVRAATNSLYWHKAW